MIISSVEEISSGPLFFKVNTAFSDYEFYLKLEGLNIAGSIKLKTAVQMVKVLIQENKIFPQTKLIESSSGNLGVALSVVCKARKIPFICVTDPNTRSVHTQLMKLHGANVICVTEKDSQGGYLGTRIKTIQAMLKTDPNLIWTNQYENPNNPGAHRLTTAKEIDEAFSKIDYLFIGAGTTGTLMGCLHYFKDHPKAPKIIAVDAEGSVTFGYPAKKRNIPGLGTSQRPAILDEALIDEVILIPEKETISACRDFLDLYGILIGGSTGTILSAIRHKQSSFNKNDKIIAISPDFGERYLDSIYNDAWVREKIG